MLASASARICRYIRVYAFIFSVLGSTLVLMKALMLVVPRVRAVLVTVAVQATTSGESSALATRTTEETSPTRWVTTWNLSTSDLALKCSLSRSATGTRKRMRRVVCV